MAKTVTLSASGVVKAGSGLVYTVNVTKPGTGASSWTLFDNPSAGSGSVVASGDGLASQSFTLQSPTAGTEVATGMFLALAGTTAPTVVVVYE